MKFPAGFTNFKPKERKDLKKIGVSDAQIDYLRLALPKIRMFASPSSYARSKEVSRSIEELERLSTTLSKRLLNLAMRKNASQALVYALIEDAFWTDPDLLPGEGLDVLCRVMPQLQALSKAIKGAKANQPKRRGRTPTADPRPVRMIDEALGLGWRMDQGSRVRATPTNETLEDMTADAQAYPPLPPYPDTFHPSNAEHSVFREIVGICYRTVEANSEPVRAIENYLARERRKDRAAKAAMQRGIDEATRRRKPKTKLG